LKNNTIKFKRRVCGENRKIVLLNVDSGIQTNCWKYACDKIEKQAKMWDKEYDKCKFTENQLNNGSFSSGQMLLLYCSVQTFQELTIA
jgi:uncharacterized protein YhbP (UPF0306 family)